MLSKNLFQKVMDKLPEIPVCDPELECLSEHAPLKAERVTTTVTIKLTAGVPVTIALKVE